MSTPVFSLKLRTLFILVCLLATFGLMALPAGQAQALEDLPTVTENDLSSGKINGENWMSGISVRQPSACARTSTRLVVLFGLVCLVSVSTIAVSSRKRG